MNVERLLESIAAVPVSSTIDGGSGYLVADGEHKVVVAEGSSADLLLLDGGSDAHVGIKLMRGACLRVVHLVGESSTIRLDVSVEADAECRMTQVVLSPSVNRVEVSLDECGARFDMNGLFILAEEERGEVEVNVRHSSSNCSSRTMVKGVASGSARGRFSGLIYVAPDAQRTDAEQLSRNVVTGDARIETLPQLEIYADDVKCSHGATVGQMDAEAILYMRQRGLSLAAAKRLQLEGFVSDVVMHVAVEALAEPLQDLLTDKFSRL